MGLRPSGECSRLLVPRVDPFDVTSSTERFGHPIQAVTDDTVYSADASGMKNLSQNIRNLMRHDILLLFVSVTSR
jgi:hypothetical protein